MWATATRRCEYTLGGHTASVNVVRWGGGGLDGKGVLYTASSDRTVRVWDSEGVSLLFLLLRRETECSYALRGDYCIRLKTTLTG